MKEKLKKLNDFEWLLPKGSRDKMNVDAKIIANDAVMGALEDDATAVTNAFVNVEGITRIGPGVAFLGESWLVFRDASAGGADVVFVPGVAMRFYTRRVAIDAGLVPFDSAVFTGSMAIVPVPMFSVAYAWRGPR